MADTLTDARLERERDFHDRRFTEENRMSQKKYYAALANGIDLFTNRVAELSRDADVLEYGCAKGVKSLELAPVCRSVHGIDISSVAVGVANAEAARLGLGNAQFTAMNAEDMTFADGSFDVVFGRGIIHHLDVEKSFREISRVLRPNGTALFWEPLGHNILINGYRRSTPDARTADEHPLLRPDFVTAGRFFKQSSLSFYGLTSLLSVPLRNSRLGAPMLSLTSAVDRALFSIPGVKWQAWHCLMELTPRAA